MAIKKVIAELRDQELMENDLKALRRIIRILANMSYNRRRRIIDAMNTYYSDEFDKPTESEAADE